MSGVKPSIEPAANDEAPTTCADVRVAATLVNGRARVWSGPFSWDVDLGANGRASRLAPGPDAYCLGAIAASAALFVRDVFSGAENEDLDELEVRAGIPGGAGELSVVLTVSSPPSIEAGHLDAALESWHRRLSATFPLADPARLTVRIEAAPLALPGRLC